MTCEQLLMEMKMKMKRIGEKKHFQGSMYLGHVISMCFSKPEIEWAHCMI